MKIKSFYTTSPIFEGGRFDDDKPVCVFAVPAVFLHMMRCLLDGESDDTPIDESKGRTFVSRVNFEIDDEDIELCGVLCDDQSFFVAVKDREHFSAEQTQKVIAKLRSMKRDDRNSYNFLNRYVANCTLNECEKYLDSLDNLGLAIIDGFHYSKKSESEKCFEQKFGNLMRNLKIYTKRRNIPIILSSGFFKNKNLANPQNFMTCLRGDMLCDCDIVMNVFKHSNDNTKAKIIIGKNRDRGFDEITILLE